MKKGIRAVCFLLILCVVNIYAYHVLSWKDTKGISQFYEYDKDSMDVIFFGSSHVIYGINTSTLWDNHGIASFSMTEGGQNLGSTYYYMKEALKYQHPKLMVVELTFASWQDGGFGDGNLYRNTLNYRFSKDYFENLRYAVGVAKNLEGEKVDKSVYKNILLKFPVVHGRYDELVPADFKRTDVKQGRFETMWTVSPMGDYCGHIDDTARCVNGMADVVDAEYIDKMIELAEANNTQIMFWVAPFVVSDVDMERYNTISDYLTSRGYPFCNMSTRAWVNETGFDYNTDMMESSHVNYYGAEKMTNYMDRYLSEHYELPDRRGDGQYTIYQEISDNWKLYYAEYAPQ